MYVHMFVYVVRGMMHEYNHVRTCMQLDKTTIMSLSLPAILLTTSVTEPLPLPPLPLDPPPPPLNPPLKLPLKLPPLMLPLSQLAPQFQQVHVRMPLIIMLLQVKNRRLQLLVSDTCMCYRAWSGTPAASTAVAMPGLRAVTW